MRITGIDFRVSPGGKHIAISYATPKKLFNILTPSSRDLYEFADVNGYLSWFEDKLDGHGEYRQVYGSRTFGELLEDDTEILDMLELYIYQQINNEQQNSLLTF